MHPYENINCIIITVLVHNVHSSVFNNNFLIRLEDVVKVNRELKQTIAEQATIIKETNATLAEMTAKVDAMNTTFTKQKGKKSLRKVAG